jgi:glycosyltransferase involved in cell wall biosynthesis
MLELVRRTAGIVTLSGYVREFIRTWSGLDATVLRFPVYGEGPFPALGRFDGELVTIINPSINKGLSIFAAVARAMPEVRFGAVESTQTTDEDRALLRSLPNVALVPFSNRIDEVLARTRVLMVPSLWDEAFGYVVIEAMLRGVPVLASDTGGLPEAKLGVEHVIPVQPIRWEQSPGTDGFTAVVPPQDISGWTRALGGLTKERDRYEDLSRRSREAALEFFAGVGPAAFESYFARVRGLTS